MPTYRNRRTGRKVTYGEANARLEELSDHWARVGEDEPDSDEPKSEVEQEAGDNGASTDTGRVPEPVEQTGGPDELEGDGQGEALPERPAKSASRATWAAYAERFGHEIDSDMTKAEIVAEVDRTPESSGS